MELMRRRRGIMGLNVGAVVPIITATATGNPLSFITDMVRPLKSLVIPFTPIQAAGTPSPDNPLPISGWTGANIYNEETYDASATPKLTINWQTEAGTVYGGTLTLNEDGSADLVANYASREYDGSEDERWSLYTAQNGFQIHISSGWQNYAKGWCNALNTVRSASAYAENTCVFGLATSSFYAIRVSALLTEYTVAAWKTYLANNPLQVVFKLGTPITYHFDDVGQLITFVGTNNIWTDTNDTNTATYLKHQS